MTEPATIQATEAEAHDRRSKKPFYKGLSFWVFVAMMLAIALGFFFPAKAIAMKPLGDVFIRMISSIITLVIFCTVSSGIAGMRDMKKVGRVGGKALLYFEVVSTFALLIGLLSAHMLKPGVGFNIDPATLDTKAISQYVTQAHGQSTVEFFMHI